MWGKHLRNGNFKLGGDPFNFLVFFNDTHNNLPLMYGKLPVESDGSSISTQFEHFLLRPESITPPEICWQCTYEYTYMPGRILLDGITGVRLEAALLDKAHKILFTIHYVIYFLIYARASLVFIRFCCAGLTWDLLWNFTSTCFHIMYFLPRCCQTA